MACDPPDTANSIGQPVVVWLTGLSGAGKSTVAQHAQRALLARGLASCVLDGDVLRATLSRDLDFSPEGRAEAVRRAAEIARVIAQQGIVVIVALVSPYRADRDRARGRLPAGGFIEVHVDAPIAVCAERDPKGHYRRARDGHLTGLTGVDAPYEAPHAPELQRRERLPRAPAQAPEPPPTGSHDATGPSIR